MSDDALLQLLRQCRENNRKWDITGMLLYSEGSFMQVLEGSADVIDPLLATIERDPRHKGVLRLLRRELTERQFGDWAMGFRNTKMLSPAERTEVSDFLERSRQTGQSGAESAAAATEALRMLETFRNLMP